MKTLPLTILLATTIIAGCASSVTRQTLENSFQLSPGMKKSDVLSVMGTPVKSEFYKGIEEWHYCRTGIRIDEFVAVYFEAETVIAMKPYAVTLDEADGVTGSCELFVKKGSYREPDTVKEYRVKWN